MTKEQGSSAESLPRTGLVSAEDIRRIILDGDAETLVNCAKRMGRGLEEGDVARHEVLGIYGDIWRIEMAWLTRPAEAQRGLQMLKPKLAYLAKIAEETADAEEPPPIAALTTVLCQALDVVLEQADEAEGHDTARQRAFERFVSFFEAIVAYHRYHGGRD